MDKLKQWTALTVVAVLAVAAAGWFLLISPTRAEAAELREQAELQRSTNSQLAQQLQVLEAKAEDLPAQLEKLAAVEAKIPPDPAVPGLIRALTAAASGAGVEFVSLVPGTPTAAVVAAASAPVAAPSGDSETVAAPVAPAPSALSVIPVTINVVGGYYQVQQYLAALEDLPRALRVSNLALSLGLSPVDTADRAADDRSAVDGSSLTSVITGEIFTSAGAGAPGAAPAGATASAAPVATTPVQPAN